MELKKQLVRATNTPAFSFICGGTPWATLVLVVIFRHEPSLSWYMAGLLALLFTYPGALLNMLWSKRKGSEPYLQITIVMTFVVLFLVRNITETNSPRTGSYTELESFVLLATLNCSVVILRILCDIVRTAKARFIGQ